MNIVELTGMYGMSEKERAFYRKNRDDTYDFVGRKGRATPLSDEQAKQILADKDKYIKKYRAKDLKIVKI